MATARKRARGIAVICAIGMLLFGLVPVALAGTQGSCDAGDTTKVLLWENGIGDLSDGDDKLWKCGGDSDLTNDAHTLAGNCKDGAFGSSTWNDCVNSISLYVPANVQFCMYVHTVWGNVIWTKVGNFLDPVRGARFNVPGDRISSFRWVQWQAGHQDDPYWSCRV